MVVALCAVSWPGQACGELSSSEGRGGSAGAKSFHCTEGGRAGVAMPHVGVKAEELPSVSLQLPHSPDFAIS
jgi:hypothetical protein